jgi:hypothetical protein
LLIKPSFRPHKQPARSFNPKIMGRIKEEIEWLLETKFIWTYRYAEWVSNIVIVEKKNTGKVRIYVDFHDLNMATPKDEYPMPISDNLSNKASGNKMISF